MANEKKTAAVYETLENVTFAYAKIAESDFKYGSKVDKEFSIDCIVDKATAKKFKKQFPKQSVKEFDNDEFEQKYKIAPPFADQDEQYVIKLKKPHIKDGKEMPYRPKAFIYAEDGKTLIDISVSKLASNGSKGKVRYRVTTNDFGTFSQLDSVLFEHFIEYKKEGNSGSPFGIPVAKVEEENKAATQARASAAPKQEAVADEEEDDSVPF